MTRLASPQAAAGEVRAVSGAGRHLCGRGRAELPHGADLPRRLPLETRDGPAAAGGRQPQGEERVTGESWNSAAVPEPAYFQRGKLLVR